MTNSLFTNGTDERKRMLWENMFWCIMSIATLLPKTSLKIAHLNICSLRNEAYEMTDLLFLNTISIFTISETPLDETWNMNWCLYNDIIYTERIKLRIGEV